MATTFDTPTPLLTLTRGLAVRPLLHSDAPSMAKHGNNVKVERNMTNRWPHPYTTDSAHAFVAFVRDHKQWRAISNVSSPTVQDIPEGTKAPLDWAIALDGEFIGATGLIFQTDVEERTARLGYWIAEEHWGKGFAPEVVRAFITWTWEAYPELDRLEATVYSWNPASVKVLLKLGFTQEGRLKAAVYKMGRRCDLLVFGLTRPGLEIASDPPN
ncbi:uncharacterized protein HMPREF1541_09434 [Cyphellophora europaea CBS 101466]|uniref:N-acetyltransferase domain-containing protein n=1 Tax=Cyphellophora europaea (strain CBS 101466) TaxID=1220924 RepID=W2SA79_CYPE1|nr:uncharacterized protein HMPREF1541_09434 [Cyphellophora europaea CBS 101466]ETN45602.1 hypothetical protein HMPREF1541_09434 [Cyphellophora europaea CBS 101466]